MNTVVWQQLLSLESRDIVGIWFKKINGRELNARRAKEVTASARQAREFFRNASESNNSVKPLLTYYGVASLARALTLLLRRDGGEEGLVRGHGLETVDWNKQLAGDLSVGLAGIGGLKIRTRAGLFSDLLKVTDNRMSMHVRSAAVDWRLSYKSPELGDELRFEQLTSRLPDLRTEHEFIGLVGMYANINEMKYTDADGVTIKVPHTSAQHIQAAYSSLGYNCAESDKWITISGPKELMAAQTPQFIHAYVHKSFGVIPDLFLAPPLESGSRYSQLCITFMLGFVLGMLARYYPTHWVALSQGDKGDALWPTLNQAHRIVEHSFPELVAEMIDDLLKQAGKSGDPNKSA